jgi:hypothetical protein
VFLGELNKKFLVFFFFSIPKQARGKRVGEEQYFFLPSKSDCCLLGLSHRELETFPFYSIFIACRRQDK